MTTSLPQPPVSNRKYTLADCPPGTHPTIWRKMIEQGTVESGRGENLPEVTEIYWETEDEFERFLNRIAEQRNRSRQS